MFQLNDSDQQHLLKVARESVHACLNGQPSSLQKAASGVLSEVHGAFVSIHKQNELRGCIGNVHPVNTLMATVAECAVSAAIADPRFAPMTMDELPHVGFEISVLSAMERVIDVKSIEVGRDGLYISKRSSRGLLLPQVAISYGWDREHFLAEACRKAGLRDDAWKQDATIFRFSAHVFQEQPSVELT
jgi:AmmeMemoRadiSam system protein A